MKYLDSTLAYIALTILGALALGSIYLWIKDRVYVQQLASPLPNGFVKETKEPTHP
jgi:hypothetical protein